MADGPNATAREGAVNTPSAAAQKVEASAPAATAVITEGVATPTSGETAQPQQEGSLQGPDATAKVQAMLTSSGGDLTKTLTQLANEQAPATATTVDTTSTAETAPPPNLPKTPQE